MRSAHVALALAVGIGPAAGCKHRRPGSAPDPTVPPRLLLHQDGVENAYPRLSNDGREILYQSKATATATRTSTS